MVKRIVLSILFSVSIFVFASAQEGIEGIIPCVDSLINSSCNSSTYTEATIIVEDKIIIKTKSSTDTITDKRLIEWISERMDSIRVVKLQDGSLECYLLFSQNLHGTGVATNFISWLIISPALNYFIELQSLSPNYKLFFFNRNKRQLMYYQLTYGKYFSMFKDWNKVDFQIKTYEINRKGESELLFDNCSWCE